MRATSTLEHAAGPAPATGLAPPRSWTRAFEDLAEGLRHRELWAHLGWQDIKQRYRRSVIGPLWITISMGVTAVALGILYSQLFQSTLGTFLPYITVGFIVWGFVSGCVLEGTDTFIANEGLIKHLPAPISVYVLRTVWRQTLFFAHNLVIYFIVLAIFFRNLDHEYRLQPDGIPHPGLTWTVVFAIPAFALLVVNGVWVALLFGIVATRFRDVPPVIGSLINLVFFMTPIVWSADILTKVSQGHSTAKAALAELNPLYHYVEIIRAPLLGQQQHWQHWAVVGGLTVVGWAVALVALRNYRARISYWV